MYKKRKKKPKVPAHDGRGKGIRAVRGQMGCDDIEPIGKGSQKNIQHFRKWRRALRRQKCMTS